MVPHHPLNHRTARLAGMLALGAAAWCGGGAPPEVVTAIQTCCTHHTSCMSRTALPLAACRFGGGAEQQPAAPRGVAQSSCLRAMLRGVRLLVWFIKDLLCVVPIPVRFALAAVFACVAVGGQMFFAMVVPLLVGRGVANRCPVPLHNISDFYTFTIGLSVLSWCRAWFWLAPAPVDVIFLCSSVLLFLCPQVFDRLRRPGCVGTRCMQLELQSLWFTVLLLILAVWAPTFAQFVVKFARRYAEALHIAWAVCTRSLQLVQIVTLCVLWYAATPVLAGFAVILVLQARRFFPSPIVPYVWTCTVCQ